MSAEGGANIDNPQGSPQVDKSLPSSRPPLPKGYIDIGYGPVDIRTPFEKLQDRLSFVKIPSPVKSVGRGILKTGKFIAKVSEKIGDVDINDSDFS